MWFVYIIRCSDESLYTGVTTDLDRRLEEHNSSEKGAKYTRAKRPVSLVYSAKFKTRSDATKEEYRIKQLSRNEKLEMIQKS